MFYKQQDDKNRAVNKKDGNNLDVVILMAGEGRRLLPLTKDRPKALLCCEDGISIFEHIINAFLANNMDVTIIPVIGHGRYKVIEEMDKLSGKVRFRSVTNPFYATSGPLVSFWLGLVQSSSDRLIVLNGDTIIKESLAGTVEQWFAAEAGSTLKPNLGICTTRADVFIRDDMKILLNEDQVISQVGKDILPGPGVIKSAGVLCIKDSRSKKALMTKLDSLLMGENALRTKYYWHNILNEVNGVFDIELISVDKDSWHEVDTDNDLKKMS